MTTITNATVEDIRELADVFRVLSDPTRLRILSMLAKGERNVGDLCGEIRLPQPTVSHHLGILRLHSVIASRRDGKHIYYSLDGRTDVGEGDSLSIYTRSLAVRIASPEASTASVAS
jgi:DNA-binding transcriptional ArsR family regulator